MVGRMIENSDRGITIDKTLAQVEAGEVSPPETAEALIALLPEIDWP